MSAKRYDSTSTRVITPEMPVWYDPVTPLGSAVRYLAGLSPKFNWVGISRFKGKRLILGPFIGARARGAGTCSEFTVHVRAQDGSILGQVDIESHVPAAFGSAFGANEQDAVRKVVAELGELWPV
jgi:putative methionine-R-sulfoxide reductase with GAF domain